MSALVDTCSTIEVYEVVAVARWPLSVARPSQPWAALPSPRGAPDAEVVDPGVRVLECCCGSRAGSSPTC